jgi:cytochrome b561
MLQQHESPVRSVLGSLAVIALVVGGSAFAYTAGWLSPNRLTPGNKMLQALIPPSGVSHYALYGLMIVMPLLGWAMLSAAAYPVVLYGGIQLPSLLPQSDSLHTPLWNIHYYLAFAFFALVLMHIAAALFHALVRHDGVFQTMAPGPHVGPARLRDEVAAAE